MITRPDRPLPRTWPSRSGCKRTTSLAMLLGLGAWAVDMAGSHVMNSNSGISEGGRERLRDAIDKQVRLDFQHELAATTEFWARAAIEKKIADEVKRRMKEDASPQSLWGAS